MPTVKKGFKGPKPTASKNFRLPFFLSYQRDRYRLVKLYIEPWKVGVWGQLKSLWFFYQNPSKKIDSVWFFSFGITKKLNDFYKKKQTVQYIQQFFFIL